MTVKTVFVVFVVYILLVGATLHYRPTYEVSSTTLRYSPEVIEQKRSQRAELLNILQSGKDRNPRDNASRAYELSLQLFEMGAVDDDTFESAEKAIAFGAKMPSQISSELTEGLHNRWILPQDKMFANITEAIKDYRKRNKH